MNSTVTAGNPSGKGSGMVETRSSPHCTNCCRIDEEKKRNDADNEEGVALHHSCFHHLDGSLLLLCCWLVTVTLITYFSQIYFLKLKESAHGKSNKATLSTVTFELHF